MEAGRAEVAALGGAAWWRRHLLWPLAIWAVIVALWSASGWDFASMQPWATPEGFPRRGAFLWSVVLHKGARRVSAGLALALFAASLVGWRVRPKSAWPGSGVAVALTLGVTSLFVALLKALTDHPCPWDYAQWGGTVVRGVLDPARAPIHGWPAAHASAGFGWIGLYFAARWHGVRHPARWLLPGLLLGLIFAATQHLRGAHFPSHNAWTLLIAWASAITVHATRAALARRRA